MFVVLNVIDTGKRKIKRSKTVLNMRETLLDNNDKFFVVDVAQTQRGINQNDVENFLGSYSKKAVMNGYASKLLGGSVKPFVPDLFFNVLLFNTVAVMIKELYLCGMRTKCYINDPSGEFALMLSDIVRYSAQTVVITQNEHKYYPCVQTIYSDMGATVTITKKSKQIPTDAILIDTAGTMFGGGALTFSTKNGIAPSEISGFENLKQLCPDFIDENIFLAAVYELTRNSDTLSEAFCCTLNMGGTKISLQDLIHIAKQKIYKGVYSEKSIIFYV